MAHGQHDERPCSRRLWRNSDNLGGSLGRLAGPEHAHDFDATACPHAAGQRNRRQEDPLVWMPIGADIMLHRIVLEEHGEPVRRQRHPRNEAVGFEVEHCRDAPNSRKSDVVFDHLAATDPAAKLRHRRCDHLGCAHHGSAWLLTHLPAGNDIRHDVVRKAPGDAMSSHDR